MCSVQAGMNLFLTTSKEGEMYYSEKRDFYKKLEHRLIEIRSTTPYLASSKFSHIIISYYNAVTKVKYL